MTLMKMKKIYTAPALEVFEFEGENLLLGSPTKDIIVDNTTEAPAPGGGEGGEGGNWGDAWMTNKNNSWNHTWE